MKKILLTIVILVALKLSCIAQFRVKLEKYNANEYYVSYSNDNGELWGCLQYFIPNMGMGCRTYPLVQATKIAKSLNSLKDADKLNQVEFKKQNKHLQLNTIIIK